MHPEMTTRSLIFTENSLINNRHLDSVQKCDLETKSWDQNMCFEVQTNFGGILKARKQILSTPCCCCSSEGNRTTGKSYYLLSVCLKKIDLITPPILHASSFLKQRFGLLLPPLCYLEQRGVRVRAAGCRNSWLPRTSPFVHWGYIFQYGT